MACSLFLGPDNWSGLTQGTTDFSSVLDSLSCIWWFPKIGVPLVIILTSMGFSRVNDLNFGVPSMTMETPI